MREKEPEPGELQTPEYAERRTAITKQYPDFDSNIPQYASPSTLSPTTSSTTTAGYDSVGMPWEKKLSIKKLNQVTIKIWERCKALLNDIEIQEGHLNKKRYYIPKHYIQGFDGEHLHAALTKDEIKSRYERDAPPSESEFQNQEKLNKIFDRGLLLRSLLREYR